MGREGQHRRRHREERRAKRCSDSEVPPSLGEVVGASPAEVDRILRDWLPALESEGLLSGRTTKNVSNLLSCRTPALGGTLHLCESCGDCHEVHRSCRDRHCPKCPALDSARWEQARKARALPAPYFHTVLTIPGRLRFLYKNKKNQSLLYSRLLSLASRTTLDLAEERLGHGARSGLTAVLHTWNRETAFHVHAHLLVLGGGVTKDGRWLERKEESLLPKDVLRARFRDAILEDLRALLDAGELDLGGRAPHSLRADLERLHGIDWIVYAKRTLRGADEAIGYLARYTSKVALSNDRILHYDGRSVTLSTKNGQSVTLDALEFCRRFLSHFLPKGFVRIRHYGALSPRNVPTLLARARAALAEQGRVVEVHEDAKGGWEDLMFSVTGTDVRKCPACGATRVQLEIRPGESLDHVLARRYRARAPTAEVRS